MDTKEEKKQEAKQETTQETTKPAVKGPKKWLKRTARFFLWLLGFIVLALVVNPLWLGPVVKGIAGSIVSGKTGCEFKMESCSINLWTGKIYLGKTHLANPKGYGDTNAVSFDSVSVDLDIGSVLSKKIHVRNVVVESPYVSYVFDDEGSNNFARIAAAFAGDEKAEPAPAGEQTAAKEESGKKVVIDRLEINGTKVKYRMVTLPIPLPTFTDIGGGDDKDGATVEEVSDTVWQQAKTKLTGIGSMATDGAKQLGNAAADGAKQLGNAAAEGAKAVGDKLKSLNPFSKDK